MAKWNGDTTKGSPYEEYRKQGYSHEEAVGLIEGMFTRGDVNISSYINTMKSGDIEKKCRCENCKSFITKEEKSKNLGFCNECEEEGYWIDPAGGIHCGDDDPSTMYE